MSVCGQYRCTMMQLDGQEFMERAGMIFSFPSSRKIKIDIKHFERLTYSTIPVPSPRNCSKRKNNFGLPPKWPL
ncbi:hypothetical protein BCR41DRAFT_348197 [Lobosporangium transversale]|uniref:Uncharacterized protein n=1 Tax=Lobosporangium transversale TaxID=64571 RepID=A0A1Y2GVV0_9FUNG|nr:hypothetical protein BCR41DRAFT_348197 [Lobosporangium transversale]ORZ26385.1 hypothetical protein BCR41DRAFT_348197 [Lobosporangium transversale]|eukprot:XP_021884150.1 hypothetical protein BCR41DRAFT_348197 [Lobosporangium transversale]